MNTGNNFLVPFLLPILKNSLKQINVQQGNVFGVKWLAG